MLGRTTDSAGQVHTIMIATMTPVITFSSGTTSWFLDYNFVATSLTAITGGGCVTLSVPSAFGGCAAGATTGLTLTSDQLVDVQVQWGTSSASNTLTANFVSASPIS